uniref:G_PROTEIN_RECEP_F3_4 domain-containing protein n=1 Tax=Steinernema glaseri TaxID=37863 RepID=A0A1I7ZFF9_9BILA
MVVCCRTVLLIYELVVYHRSLSVSVKYISVRAQKSVGPASGEMVGGGRAVTYLCVLFAVFSLLPRDAESCQALQLVQTCGELTIIGSNGNNLIVSTLLNISLELSGQELVVWQQLIQQCNATSYNTSLSSQQIIAICAAKIELIFAQYQDIYQQFIYWSLGGWGVFNDLFQIASYFNAPFTQGVLVIASYFNAPFTQGVLVVQNGSCALQLAIKAYEATCSNQTEIIALNGLLFQIGSVVNNASLSYSQKMGVLSSIFQQFFASYPAWKLGIISTVIPGFNTIEAFLDVADEYFRIGILAQLFVVDSGQTQCRLFVDLTADVNNPAYNLTQDQKTLILTMINETEVLLENSTSLSFQDQAGLIIAEYTAVLGQVQSLEYIVRGFPIGTKYGFGTFGDLINMFDFLYFHLMKYGGLFKWAVHDMLRPLHHSTSLQMHTGFAIEKHDNIYYFAHSGSIPILQSAEDSPSVLCMIPFAHCTIRPVYRRTRGSPSKVRRTASSSRHLRRRTGTKQPFESDAVVFSSKCVRQCFDISQWSIRGAGMPVKRLSSWYSSQLCCLLMGTLFLAHAWRTGGHLTDNEMSLRSEP